MKSLRHLAVFWFFTIWVTLAPCQTETGVVSGTVTDPLGALLPGASITLTSVETHATRTSVSNAEGLYTIPHVQPGLLDLAIQAPGFATLTRRVEITVGSHIRGDAQLKVAEAITSVEVLGEGGVQVETQTQTLSQVVSGKQITELPTVTRNPYDLVAISGNISTEDPTGRGVGVAINGQRAASTNVTLNGGENMLLFTAVVASSGLLPSVPLDSVKEFRLSHGSFTAESGRASGGVVDVATKSGTNEFHGTLYAFNRISALAANSYDNNANGLPRGVFVRNQFGYSLGGPIRKDRLFFFVSTEWIRVRSNVQQIVLVPTPEFITAAAPNTQQFMNTFGTLSTPINGPVFTKAALVNAGEISPDPGSSLDLLPDATPIFGQVAFSVPSDAGGGGPQNSLSLLARLDYNLSKDTTLSGYYALVSSDFFPGLFSPSPYAGYNIGANPLENNSQLSLTHVFSPALVSQTKLGFNSLHNEVPLGTAPRGNPALFASGAPFGRPIALPGYRDVFFSGTEYNLQFQQDVSLVRGNHQLRLGGEYIHSRDNFTVGTGEQGQEGLGFSETRSLENFLNGKLRSFGVAIDPQGKFPCTTNLDTTLIQTPECTLSLPVGPPNFSRSNRFNDFAVYVQDTWKLQRRLTVNLGLRWEYYGIQHNKDPNLDSNFYFGPGSNFAEQIRHGQVFTVPRSPIGSLSQPRYGNMGPRIGFAWDLFGDGKTSLRGGYGIGYERNFGEATFNIILNPPAQGTLSLIAGVDVPSLDLTTNNFGPLGGSSGTQPFFTTKVVAVNPNLRTAFAHFWSAAFEHQVAKDTVLSLEYSGSRGVHLYSIEDINRAGFGVVYGSDDPGVNAVSRLNRQYTAINMRGNNGLSVYNALNVGLRSNHLASTGLSFTLNYTWAHTIDNLSSTFSESLNNFNFGVLDLLNPRFDRGNSDFDLRHRFVASAIWEEPFFAESSHRWLRSTLGGWSFAPVFTARTGIPFSIYDCSNAAEYCPRYIPTEAVSTAAQSPVPTGQPNFFSYLPLSPAVSYVNPLTGISDIGDCTQVAAPPCPFPSNMTGRNIFRAPGFWNLELGVYKSFQLPKGMRLQARGEFFNTFNHPNLFVHTDLAEITTNPNFISAFKNGKRNLQLALKLIF
jgi:hypothetical protein